MCLMCARKSKSANVTEGEATACAGKQGVLEVRSERQCKPGTKGGVADASVILQLLGIVSEFDCYLKLCNGFHNLNYILT